MSEHGLVYEILKYGSYLLIGLIGWFLRRHVDKTDLKEKEQDSKLEILDKRLDGHDVSRADIRAQILSMYQILKKMDKNIDRLLDKK